MNYITTINQIADRAIKVYLQLGLIDAKSVEFARRGIAMELRIVHEDIVPLRLGELLEADDTNLIHDVAGIHRHLDLANGKLNDCFLPRFARMQ